MGADLVLFGTVIHLVLQLGSGGVARWSPEPWSREATSQARLSILNKDPRLKQLSWKFHVLRLCARSLLLHDSLLIFNTDEPRRV